MHLCKNSCPIVSSYTNRAYRYANTFPQHLHKLCVVCGIVSFFPRGFVYLFLCVRKSVSHCPSIWSGGCCCSCWLLVAGDDTVHHFARRQPALRPAQLQSRRHTAKHEAKKRRDFAFFKDKKVKKSPCCQTYITLEAKLITCLPRSFSARTPTLAEEKKTNSCRESLSLISPPRPPH